MEPWETLDVDDSDLPALLRPCKRQARHWSPPSISPDRLPPPPVSQEDIRSSCQQLPPSASKPPCQIPGPAGAVQAAMRQKTMDQRNRNFVPSEVDQMDDNSRSDSVIPTQEYIRRAVEDTVEFDDDFTRNPWFCALEDLGAVDGMIPSTPICSINKCLNVGKVDKVVAVIKSCTSNGLGGLLVTLKDPTGTIGASIHHNVLSESEYGKDLSIGAVLILQKVSIFKPLQSAQYLNITLRNLLKVFCKESGPPSRQVFFGSGHPLQYADPGIEYLGKASTSHKLFTSENRRLEKTAKESRFSPRKNLPKNDRLDKENFFSGSFHANNRAGTSLNVGVKKDQVALKGEVPNEASEDALKTKTQDHFQQFSNLDRGCTRGRNLQDSLINDSTVASVVSTNSGEEVLSTNGVQKQRQPLIVSASLPQWTDEQLEELFAADGDDGLF